MNQVAVFGSLNLDVSHRVSRFPVPGETMIVTDRVMAFGGKGGNQAIAAAVLGADVTMVGAVGNDEAGAAYLSHLRSHGIDVHGIATLEDHPTGSAMILIDDRGENLILVDPGANSHLDVDRVRSIAASGDFDVVLMQLEVPVAALEAATQELSAQSLLILNPAPMSAHASALDTVLRRTGVLVPNRKELGQLVGANEPRTLDEVRECLAQLTFDRDVVVTLGADGAMLRASGKPPEHFPARRLEPVDTTGAGDAFCGALAAHLAAGRSIEESLELAIDVAGRCTLRRGAQLTRSSSDATARQE